jgi:cytoskeletal protein RodZ
LQSFLTTKKKKKMKKVFAILALALFIGGIGAPAIAANSNALAVISLNEEDPKKKEATKKEAKKEATKSETKKSSDCATEKKKSDCSK